MTTNAPAMTPYKGLMAYREEDADFFFGRTQVSEIIVANLIASRLTLLYGTSGVGKSSVLHAGVVHHFRQRAKEDLAIRGAPKYVVVVLSSWRDDPLVELERRVEDAIRKTFSDRTFEPVTPSRSLSATLHAWTERANVNLLIIFDQFEDYFLYHNHETEDGSFALEFPRAVNDTSLHANFLISIREDALSKLDRFKGRIPNVFGNYLRIEYLSREEAREAIEKPIEKYNERYVKNGGQISIEPKLVDSVLEQVKTGQVILGKVGLGVAETDDTHIQIETPFLQLVMTRLWDEEIHAGSRVLHFDTLKNLGGAKTVVRTHLDTAMKTLPRSERRILTRLYPHLVTPSGNKMIQALSDLADYGKCSQEKLAGILEKASSAEMRIVRPVPPAPNQPNMPRYEIFHDVLALAIADYQKESTARSIKIFRNSTVVLAALFTLALIAIFAASIQEAQLRADRELFFVEQNRIATLAAGGAFVSDIRENQSPEDFLNAVTAAAKLNQWQPVTQDFNGVEMLEVPAGCFWMGSIFSRDEQPVHEVCFAKPFWIDKYEVTNAQFPQVTNAPQDDKSSSKAELNQPRVEISWFEAHDYCMRRGGRLPTEAEWEYAARGPDSLAYPWGNDFRPNVVVYASNSNRKAANVGSRPDGMSWVGAMDMSGNVGEWTSTIYFSRYDAEGDRESLEEKNAARVWRGGTFLVTDAGLRSALRTRTTPSSPSSDIGFRCARS